MSEQKIDLQKMKAGDFTQEFPEMVASLDAIRGGAKTKDQLICLLVKWLNLSGVLPRMSFSLKSALVQKWTLWKTSSQCLTKA